MKNYTRLRRTLLLLSASTLAWPTVSLSFGQTPPAAATTSQPAPKAPEPEKKIPVETVKNERTDVSRDDETLVLSPFEVVTDNKGYYSSSTMSGTRFKTKIEDVGSSITVMNKDQMTDFGMVDINDVFNYVGNAEGTGTYTDFVVDRNGQAFDNNQLNPNNANRLRGISSANQSFANFEVSKSMPVDSMLVEAIEISRGPNANVFGLGNAGGTVNQVPVSANLSRNKTTIELRADSYKGWRTVFDTNMVLKKNVLAIRAVGGYQDEEFQRNPSGMNTRRLNAMVKYQPFKYTTITGLAVDYKSFGNRPNYTPPRDNVSYWRSRGSPGWNPSNSTVVLNGVENGWNPAANNGRGALMPMGTSVVVGSTTTPTVAFTNSNDTTIPVPDYFFRPNYMFQRSNIYVDQNGIGYWTDPVSSSKVTPYTSSGTLRLQLPSPGYGITGNNSGGRIGSQPLFSTVPVVSDKSLYDWSEINLSAVNRLRYSTKMYLGQLDQIFLNTPTQNLTVQLAALREDNESYERTPIGNSGNSGVSGQLFVDVNTTNLDGTPNAYYGRTFIGVSEPRTVYKPSTWDTYRGQFSYRIDLSKESGALKWFGTHQISGYTEYKYRINRQYVYRDVLTSDHTWTAPGATGTDPKAARANQSSNSDASIIAGQGLLRNFVRYYVGDTNGNNVDYAPSEYAYGNYDYHYGTTPGANTTTTGFVSQKATLGRWATTDGTGGFSNLQQTIKTNGAVVQSQFLDGKLILNGGLREDKVYSKFGATPQFLVDNLSEHNWEANNHWAGGDYRFASGKTKTYGGVARPFRDLAFVTKAAESTGFQRQFGQFLRGLALTYNWSDTFFPQAPAIDLQLRQLPNITGEGKDAGLWINMFDNRLTIRVNRYNNKQLNARNGEANTVAQRVLRMDIGVGVSDNYQLHDVAERWLLQANPTWVANSDQTEDAIAAISKISRARAQTLIDAFASGTIAATNDVEAKGTEVEINFNPNKYWTIAASGEEKTSKNSNISNSVQEWLDERLPILQSIVDPRGTTGVGPGTLWWTTPYNSTRDYASNGTTAAANYEGFVKAPYAIIKQQEGKSLPSVRRYSGRVSTSYNLAGLTSQPIIKNFKVGGALRYESKGAIGYYGVMDNAGIYQSLDRDRPVYDKEHYYIDAFISYRTKIWGDKIGTNIQLNCRNLQESGRLQPIAAFPDGTAVSYRIVDPRIFMLTVTLDL